MPILNSQTTIERFEMGKEMEMNKNIDSTDNNRSQRILMQNDMIQYQYVIVEFRVVLHAV